MCCRICNVENSIENEDHILTCSVINDEEYDVKFSDVYENIEKQYKAVKVFKTVMRRRKTYLDIAEKTKTHLK